MTNEELRALLMRNGGSIPGMSPAMNNTGGPSAEDRQRWEAEAAYDPQGKEVQMAQMLRGGQDALFNTPMPQGRMMGDIYAAPTWADSLNAAAGKLVGGYQMGQARRGQEDIQAKRDQAAASQGKLNAALAAEKQVQQDFENSVATDKLDQGGRGLDLQASDIAAKNALAQGKGEVSTYHDPENPTTAINVITTPQGISHKINDDGTRGVPVNVGSLTPWSSGTGGSLTAAQLDAEKRKIADPVLGEDGGARPSVVTSFLENPKMPDAVGYNPEAILARVGLPIDPETQYLQIQAQQMMVPSLVQDISKAKLTPVSEKDRELFEKAYANDITQPFGHVMFINDTYRPFLEKRFEEAVANGVHTDESAKQYLNQIDHAIAIAAVRNDVPLENLSISPKMYRMAELEEKKRLGGM